MSDKKFMQVELSRTPELGEGLIKTITHIPSELAVVGKFIDLKEDGKWNTWQVVMISNNELSAEQSKKLAEKHHKLATNDLSLRHRKK